QADDGIRDFHVTGVQTCALPIFQWHQDNAYNGLPVEHFQLWIALTETRNANGTLWLAPGSHKRGQLPHERVPGRRQLAVRAPVERRRAPGRASAAATTGAPAPAA